MRAKDITVEKDIYIPPEDLDLNQRCVSHELLVPKSAEWSGKQGMLAKMEPLCWGLYAFEFAETHPEGVVNPLRIIAET